MTAKEAATPWYMKPIQVPILVLLLGGFAGGIGPNVAKSAMGIQPDTPAAAVDTVARAAVLKVDRKLDTIALRQESITEGLKRQEDATKEVKSLVLELLKRR